MGAVYCVTDQRTGETLALKRTLHPNKRFVVALFEREYQTLLGIQHPRIIRVYDYGIDAEGPFYTMELISGRDLSELAPVPFSDACRYLRDVATCLALLHTRRLLHRDITPRNVRVTPEGHCMLLDFGALSSFGASDRVVGTAPYVAPEALRGAPLDQRADLFSFGALAYWMLTGRHAFPARDLADLSRAWRIPPFPPSSLRPDVPEDADALILNLLNIDPGARPGSMAEVVERLNFLGALPPEDETTLQAFAQSFLVHPQFTGRESEMAALREEIGRLQRGRGGSVTVEGASGVGRTRLLGELVVEAKLLDVATLHVDASANREAHGTTAALVHQLLDVSTAAASAIQMHAVLLRRVDDRLRERLCEGGKAGVAGRAPAAGGELDAGLSVKDAMCRIVADTCSVHPLLIVIDNADDADEASLALLSALQKMASELPLGIVCSLRAQGRGDVLPTSRALCARAQRIDLGPFSAEQMLPLARSLFGDAPNLARFTGWCHEVTGGRLQHFLEIVRRLHEQGVVRYLNGLWALPPERPDAGLRQAMQALLSARLDALTERAYVLAEILAIQRGTLSRDRCLTLATLGGRDPYSRLDELLRAGVLQDTAQGYRISHELLRELLLDRMDPERKRRMHLEYAEQLLASESRADRALRSEAGFHLLQAGEEDRGAELIAKLAYGASVNFALVDGNIDASVMEAALQVYVKQGRPLHERLPLLAALAQAGYYQDRVWAERYGDEALAALDQLSGLALARKLQRWLGKTLGLGLGLLVGALRLAATRSRSGRHRLGAVPVQLFAAVTALTGVASITLDVARAERIARMLDPFAHLPERLAPVGIWQFCNALKEIGRDNPAAALASWSKLIERFRDPHYYIGLPRGARPLYLSGLWFALGVFESFRDRQGALAAANELERLDFKLDRMIASQLRVLHYAHRGELDEARRNRERVDAYAAQVGSAWQVELWEPCALGIAFASIGDVVEARRLAERIALLAQSVPSLRLYVQLHELAMDLVRLDRPELERGLIRIDIAEAALERSAQLLEAHEPRSFIGWGAVLGYTARGLNRLGRHDQARRVCERALAPLSESDREFVALFLNIETELAVAEAGLGEAAKATARLQALLQRHAESTNPLTRGRLHEAYARAAALIGDEHAFREHCDEARAWFRATRCPALIARAEALAAYGSGPAPRASYAGARAAGDTSEERTRDRRARKDDELDPMATETTEVIAPVSGVPPSGIGM